MKQNLYQATLLLNDGQSYKGWSFINTSTAYGEVVFNTGMTGYQEIITDPSYSDQMIAFTYPEIGNTGVNNQDNESCKVHVKGIIAKNICINPHNWRKNTSLYEHLIKHNIPHIFGIDTRKLAKHIRSKGVMQGRISNNSLYLKELKHKNKDTLEVQKKDKIQDVTTKISYKLQASSIKQHNLAYLNRKITTELRTSYNYKIVVIDFGVKANIIRRLLNYGCELFIIPATSSYSFILSHKPDGILLSNGPGDPSAANYAINNLQKIILYTNIPIFGICMGHQIISLALGYTTFKLKFGHRGMNHPSGIGQTSEITCQNHGFAVRLTGNSDRITQTTYINLNDLTIAGLLHKDKPIFSVQYHPEASPGPHDTDYLFNYFLKIIKLTKEKTDSYQL